MTLRHIALATVAVGVLVMGVYLFLEVRSGVAAAPEVGPRASDLGPRPEEEAQTKTVAKQATTIVPPGKHVETAAPAPAVPTSDEAHDDVPTPTPDGKPNPKLDAVMDQANKAYDRQDFDEAKAIAGKVLAKMPNNVRMLRIMVSSSCIDGDVAIATKYFPSLPKFDREQLKVRCDRYGVTLTDPPQ